MSQTKAHNAARRDHAMNAAGNPPAKRLPGAPAQRLARSHPLVANVLGGAAKAARPVAKPRPAMVALKRVVDLGFAIAGLFVLAILVPAIWCINLFKNPGPLFFTQRRMGRDCTPFTVIKFRTMLPEGARVRGFDDPLETHRITPFGGFMRRTRIDEIPQALNILRGDMSLVGPRPDAWDHAVVYCSRLQGYRTRYKVRPGLTGLAQTGLGYAEGIRGTRMKVEADIAYIRHMSPRLEWRIMVRTAWVMLRGMERIAADASRPRKPHERAEEHVQGAGAEAAARG